jgi:hypothetical protein
LPNGGPVKQALSLNVERTFDSSRKGGSDCSHLSHERKRLYNRHRPRRRRPPQRNRDREHQVVTGARAGVVGRPPRVGHLASKILQLLLQRARVGKRSRDLQLASVQTRA